MEVPVRISWGYDGDIAGYMTNQRSGVKEKWKENIVLTKGIGVYCRIVCSCVLVLWIPAHLPNLHLLGYSSEPLNQPFSSIFNNYTLFIFGIPFKKWERTPAVVFTFPIPRLLFLVSPASHRASHMAIRCAATAPKTPRRPSEPAELQTSTSSLPRHCFPVQAHFSNLWKAGGPVDCGVEHLGDLWGLVLFNSVYQ